MARQQRIVSFLYDQASPPFAVFILRDIQNLPYCSLDLPLFKTKEKAVDASNTSTYFGRELTRAGKPMA